MPKKDTSLAVLGMLSTAGAQTRPTAGADPAVPAPPPEPDPALVAAAPTVEQQASVRTLTPPATSSSLGGDAPRTLRLRPDTAARLRAAWLEAKRDDVLLTAQDFASDLVDEALVRQRRRTASVH